jgi:hypothetical protein
MSKNAAPLFHDITGFQRFHAGRFKGSEAEAVPKPSVSPCLPLALLLSLPLWGAIWVVVSAVRSAWLS